MQSSPSGFNRLQKIAMSLMAVMVFITFIGANLHAFLWQSSEWLVSTVLPAVVIDLTNDERADSSLSVLQRNSALDAAAKLKAEHMAENEYFSHFSPEGVSPWYWFKESGYTFAHAGENLAIHFTDSDEVVEAWMKSPTHRENIVNGNYTEIGVGTAKGEYEGYDTVYVVQLFGAPAVPVASSVPAGLTMAEPESISELIVEEPVSLTLSVGDVSEEATEVVKKSVTEDEISTQTEIVVSEEKLEVVEKEPSVESVVENTVADSAVLGDEIVLTTEAEEDVAGQDVAVVEESDVVIVESLTIATSSGLAVASISTLSGKSSVGSVASIATKPNALLQFVYTLLGVIVVALLSVSIVLEARRIRYVQVAYGFLLLFGMGGLWYAHSLLTSGAVIV